MALTAQDLQKIGFNDPAVIQGILSDPSQRQRYERELGVGDEFDFEYEAKKAYNELGAYYDRVLSEAKGDVNKAISRLVEDYDSGMRMKKEDVAVARKQLGINQTKDEKTLQDNALARGLYQKSAYGAEGMGIPDQNQAELTQAYDAKGQALDTGLSRYETEATTNRDRATSDLNENLKRSEFDLEQQRRTEAGNLANSRAARALRRFDSTLI